MSASSVLDLPHSVNRTAQQVFRHPVYGGCLRKLKEWSFSNLTVDGVSECLELEERVRFLITMFSMHHNNKDVRAANFETSEFVDPAVSLWIRKTYIHKIVEPPSSGPEDDLHGSGRDGPLAKSSSRRMREVATALFAREKFGQVGQQQDNSMETPYAISSKIKRHSLVRDSNDGLNIALPSPLQTHSPITTPRESTEKLNRTLFSEQQHRPVPKPKASVSPTVANRRRVTTLENATQLSMSISARETSPDRKSCPSDVLQLNKSIERNIHRSLSLEASSGESMVFQIDNPEFNVLSLDMFQLRFCASMILRTDGVLEYFKVRPEKLSKFVHTISEGYCQERPYHSFYHAVDVLHATYKFIKLVKGRFLFSGIEIYSMLVAAIAHDLAHPGLNNMFLTRVGHPLAQVYHDKSPLENMHCFQLFTILKDDSTSIFERLTLAEWAAARRIIIKAILRTDMIYHAKIVQHANYMGEKLTGTAWSYALANAETCGRFSAHPHPALKVFDDTEFRLSIIELFIHSADISSMLMKPHRLARRWGEVVCNEFLLQGDHEKGLGLPISPMCDRTKFDLAPMQIGFIDFVVSPLALSLFRLFPALQIYSFTLASNFGSFVDSKIEEIKQEKTPDMKQIDQLKARKRAFFQRIFDATRPPIPTTSLPKPQVFPTHRVMDKTPTGPLSLRKSLHSMFHSPSKRKGQRLTSSPSRSTMAEAKAEDDMSSLTRSVEWSSSVLHQKHMNYRTGRRSFSDDDRHLPSIPADDTGAEASRGRSSVQDESEQDTSLPSLTGPPPLRRASSAQISLTPTKKRSWDDDD